MPIIDKAKPAMYIAEQILWLRGDRDRKTTPMHAIKFSYICHGWMLGIYGESLSAEPAEAWKYGPVIPSVYHKYKSFRSDPIEVVPVDRADEFDAQQKEIIEGVVDSYLHYTPWQLSEITHQPGTPWDIVYRDGRGEGAIIPDSIIQEYYEKLADH